MIFGALHGSSKQVLKYHVKEGRTASLHTLSNFNNLYYCLHLIYETYVVYTASLQM